MFATGGLIQDMMVDAPGSYPVYLPMGFGDLICGTVLAGAIGTALYGRDKNGKGDYVSVSLYGAAMWMFSIMSTGTQFGYKWPRERYQGGPMGVPYKTKDNRWILQLLMNTNVTGDHSVRQWVPRRSSTIQDTAPSRLPLTRKTVKTASATLKAASLS